MVCRSKERGEAARSKIQSTTGNKNVYLEVFALFCELVVSVAFLGPSKEPYTHYHWGRQIIICFLQIYNGTTSVSL